ncbi:MAG TPA: helix-turn-helix domain-containing protein [Kribbella sp.]|jgi:excisionase family DNA binding protein
MTTAETTSNLLALPPARALYTIAEAVVLLNYSRSQVYELIRLGRLQTVCEGRSRRVPAGAITEYVNLLKLEAKEARSAEAA